MWMPWIVPSTMLSSTCTVPAARPPTTMPCSAGCSTAASWRMSVRSGVAARRGLTRPGCGRSGGRWVPDRQWRRRVPAWRSGERRRQRLHRALGLAPTAGCADRRPRAAASGWRNRRRADGPASPGPRRPAERPVAPDDCGGGDAGPVSGWVASASRRATPARTAESGHALTTRVLGGGDAAHPIGLHGGRAHIHQQEPDLEVRRPGARCGRCAPGRAATSRPGSARTVMQAWVLVSASGQLMVQSLTRTSIEPDERDGTVELGIAGRRGPAALDADVVDLDLRAAVEDDGGFAAHRPDHRRRTHPGQHHPLALGDETGFVQGVDAGGDAHLAPRRPAAGRRRPGGRRRAARSPCTRRPPLPDRPAA